MIELAVVLNPMYIEKIMMDTASYLTQSYLIGLGPVQAV